MTYVYLIHDKHNKFKTSNNDFQTSSDIEQKIKSMQNITTIIACF